MTEQTVGANKPPAARAQTFIIRVWQEDLGEGKTEWRGRVQWVDNGQVFYFRDWQMLIEQVQAMLAPSETSTHSTSE